MSAWRKQYKVHPAADLFPMMSDEEIDKLGADIKAHGLKLEIDVRRICLSDERGRPFVLEVLDGRNRLEALERAGINIDPSEHFNLMELGDDEVIAYIIAKNIHRRHLSKQEQADILVAIAKLTVGNKLVGDQPVSGPMPGILPFPDRRGGRGKKNPLKEEALKLNEALPKTQRVGLSTIKVAIAKAVGKEPKPKTFRAPLKHTPKLERHIGLDAARQCYIDKCKDEPGLDIDGEIDTITDALREIARRPRLH